MVQGIIVRKWSTVVCSIASILIESGFAVGEDEVQKEDLNEQLLELVDHRNQSLMTFSAIVSFQEAAGSQYAEYLNAMSDYEAYIASYAGVEHERKDRTVSAPGTQPPASHFQFVRLKASQRRIDHFEGVPNATLSNVQSCNCFDGVSWSFYTAINGGHLEFAETQRLTNVAGITGLELPTARIGSGQILELMQRAKIENTLTVSQQRDPDGLPAFVATFMIPGKRHVSLPILMTAVFTSRYGFAPIEFRGHEVYGPDNARALPANAFVARFANWEQVADGLHVAKELDIDLIADVLLPVDNRKGFTPLLRNGKPTPDATGLNEIDPTSFKTTSYSMASEVYRCLSFELSSLDDPLCRQKYPQGTIVQLTETGEVYQLQSEGSAIREDMKTPLEPILPSPRPDSLGTSMSKSGKLGSIGLWINLTFGLAVSVYAAYRFIRRKSN